MKKLFFVILIFIASFLRLWQLGEVPPSPDWDEAALGYNAYSIMQTGKDEYGQVLPIVLRSFDDHKPALYAYLTIPAIAVFGLDTFAVRLPSAIMGILTVVAVYFLVREMFRVNEMRHAEFSSASRILKQVQNDDKNTKYYLPAAVAFLLAISPWHIQFSRVAFEANVGLAFNIFAALFFLLGLKKRSLLMVSVIFAGLNLYVYQAEKIFTPLICLTLVLIFRKEFFSISKKYLICLVILGGIIVFPLTHYILTDPQALTRARGVSAFADQTSFLQRSSQKLLDDKERNDYLGLILDNRRLQYGIAAVSGYLSHFDLNWLFINGDEVRHHVPGMGLLYLWELPFLLLGIYSLIFGEWQKKTKLLLFFWFLLAPVSASITSDVPHAVRTLNFLPTFQIFTALGIIRFFSFKEKSFSPLGKDTSEVSEGLLGRWRNYLMTPPGRSPFGHLPGVFWQKGKTLIISSFFFFNFLYYLNQYFVQQNYFNSRNWQYGYKEAVEEIKKIELQYDKIVVSNRPHLDQSYMFFLFYLKFDPVSYQKEGRTTSGFAKFTFRPIEWKQEKKDSKILYVGRPEDFPAGIKVIKTVNFLNGTPAIKIVEG